MRIKKVTMENFRCYYGVHNFTLDSEIIILFGENGFGKSSFFDAIEWCLTGTINRFISNDKKILYNFLAKSGEICSVSIEFDTGNSLIRSFKIQEKMRETVKLISSEGVTISTGQKCLETLIEGEVQSNKKDLMDTTSLLKQALILSQDQVTDFILRDEPQERFSALADIMGYKKWTMTLNNLKKINDKIRSNIRNEQSQLTTYKKLISEKEQEMQEADVFTIDDLLRKFNLKLNSSTYTRLNEIKEAINKDVVLHKNSFNDLKKLIHVEQFSYTDFVDYVEGLKKELHKSFAAREKGLRLLTKINNKKEDVSRILKTISIEENLLDEKKKLEDQIKIISEKVGVELANNKDYFHQINGEIKSIENKKKKIIFAINSYQHYKRHKNNVKVLPKSILEEENKIKIIENDINLLKKKVTKFDQIINGKQGNEEFNSLNSSIQNIYKYVVDNSISDKCPVCMSENNGNLQEHIFSTIQNNLKQIAKDSSFVNKALRRRNELKEEYENKEKILRNVTKVVTSNREELFYSERQLIELREDSLFSLEFIELDESILQKRKKETDEKIADLHQRLLMLLDLEDTRSKYSNFINVKNTNTNKKSVIQEKQRLEKYAQKVENIINKIKENINSLDSNYDRNNQLVVVWRNTIEKSERKIPLGEILRNREEFVNQAKKSLSEIHKLEDFLEIIKGNENINILINKYKKDREELKNRLKKLSNKHKELNNFIENAYTKIGSQALDYFNKQDSSIQKYFRYLNPMPTSNRVIFKSEKEDELELIMSVEGKDGDFTDLSNVQYSMSSGQLNVLAISLFLAINEGQTLSKLDLIGIDDPIQNMDDVNQFSICDVFSNIKKQLILSTHDYDFLKLFIKKNDYRINDVKVFMLESDRFANTQVKEVTF
ncbi:SMC family ATPase [Bacillus infantis]|uniref:AAA family ATPase n=1 Tax=Bacillus infantis TaxID=324767 RepID=UPI001CD6C835|nr:SMC family ATPase [Bacillus infantis]MCA1042239.1 SMC family ATPase [Bacillus infantis]